MLGFLLQQNGKFFGDLLNEQKREESVSFDFVVFENYLNGYLIGILNVFQDI